MVDLDSSADLNQLYPRLHEELKRLRVEVIQKLMKRSTAVDGDIEQLGRMIAILSKAKNESVFSSAARALRSYMVDIEPVIAIAAAIELTAGSVNPIEEQ